MSPETQTLINVLTEVDLDSEHLPDMIKTGDTIENEMKSYYDAASDDSVEDPDFLGDNQNDSLS